jgi:hypothetical protein
MGKLSDEDYQELRQKYKNQAVEILKQLDPGRSQTTKQARAKTQTEPGTTQQVRFCWSCGANAVKGNVFCSNCGTRLQQAQN